MASKWWVASAALLTLLAGCLEAAPGADPEPVDAVDGDPTAGGNQTVPNAAPNATLEASATNGTAPLNVTLTLGGSDGDGDNLTWTLTVGNDTHNGTALPATVNVTLEAGNHTLTLVVSDGNATGNATLVITVDAAEAPEAPDVVEAGDGLCHRPGATSVEDELYVVSEGGDWVFMESNGVPGLQVENNHPIGDPVWINDAWVDCVGGDTMVN